MQKPIILIGAGPLGLNAAHIVRQQGAFEIAGFVDAKKTAVGGIEILGDDSVLESLKNRGVSHAVVCIGDPRKRIAVAAQLKQKGFALPALVHPYADLGIGAQIGEGSIIFHGSFVGAQTVIGPYCVIEAGAFVGHDCLLQEGVLLSARACLGNHVSVGSCSTFRLGAGCANKVRIGQGCVVGEFRSVLADLADNAVAEPAS